jgi:hypothetical protein
MSHHRLLCGYCGTIISQCRCMSAAKTTTYGTCTECAKKHGDCYDEGSADLVKESST